MYIHIYTQLRNYQNTKLSKTNSEVQKNLQTRNIGIGYIYMYNFETNEPRNFRKLFLEFRKFAILNLTTLKFRNQIHDPEATKPRNFRTKLRNFRKLFPEFRKFSISKFSNLGIRYTYIYTTPKPRNHETLENYFWSSENSKSRKRAYTL